MKIERNQNIKKWKNIEINIWKYEKIWYNKYEIKKRIKQEGGFKKRMQEKTIKKSNKWSAIITEEKESILNFDDFAEILHCYTRNQATGNKIKKKIGEPTKTDYIKGQIFSMTWDIPFSDRERIRQVLSINNFVTSYKSKRIVEK